MARRGGYPSDRNNVVAFPGKRDPAEPDPGPDGKNSLAELQAFCAAVPDEMLYAAIFAAVGLIERSGIYPGTGRRNADSDEMQLRRWVIVHCLIGRILAACSVPVDDPE